MDRTTWDRGEVCWDLSLTPTKQSIRPQLFPAGHLGVFDMSLVSIPDVAFDGWIEHHGLKYRVSKASGMLSHYWGRQLPSDWWWVSANQFDTDLSLECTFLHSHLWGSSVRLAVGYLYYRDRLRSTLLIAPPARIHVSGSPALFELRASPLRGPAIVLKATGRDYASLGEGIVNTLTGDLEVWEGKRLLGVARGTAGLERRSASA